MQYNTEAIVIKTVRYGETHAIVTLLTPTGRVSAMAKSAMKPTSRLAAGVRLCAQGTYFMYQGSGMGNIQQVEMVASRRRLHEDLQSAAYAAYFCDLVLSVAPERPHGQSAMYRQFAAILDALVERPQDADVLARVFETKMCHWLGVSPNWRACIRCGEPLTEKYRYHMVEGGFVCQHCATAQDTNQSYAVPSATSKILYLFERTPIEQLGNVKISAATHKALKQTLYYQLVDFGGLYLKSRDILNQLVDAFDRKDGENG
ncbi:DNA repair protein RecO [Alicyclobacillus fastidiosus]|uniref:DNA repair protein RecO n=1 Tax=Alicyclobacillus fastidiosus TaxID=392011 RepID=A0ABV5ACG3_9BACL|nr:DNA repair protein RecO [Alicyclobacillus fastidiosus]WEH11350.1 DNA repair protein RecO [Alicyclobacillus fastidiosus]